MQVDEDVGIPPTAKVRDSLARHVRAARLLRQLLRVAASRDKATTTSSLAEAGRREGSTDGR